MAKQSNIYDRNRLYSFLRPYVDRTARSIYSRVEVRGRENIPADGAVILAPNHCNTLMDALMVLQADKGSTVFGARADIFKNPAVAKILTFLRILPITRMRDGLSNVSNNWESFQKAVDTLEHDVPYCIFSEGTHRTRHSLLPIGKGVVRIALSAHEQFGASKPVYIVPMGLEYSDYFRPAGTCLVSYGKAINVSEFIKNNPDMTEAELYRELRDQIRDGISQLITYLPFDENYEGRWAFVKAQGYKAPRKLSERLENNRREVSAAMIASQDTLSKALEFEKARRKAGITSKALRSGKPVLRAVVDVICSLILLPVFICCFILDLPVWAGGETLKGIFKDRAWCNTMRFAARLILRPLLLLIYATVCIFCIRPAAIALGVFVLCVVSDRIVINGLEFFRQTISSIRLLLPSGRKALADLSVLKG